MHVFNNLPGPLTDRHYIKKHICLIHDILECETPPQRLICLSTWFPDGGSVWGLA